MSELKSFSEFCFEAVTPEDVQKNGPKVAQQLQSDIEKLLPNHVVKVGFSKNLGKSLHVLVYGKDPKSGISHNSPSFMQLMMSFNDNRGREVELDKVSFDKLNFAFQLKDHGVRYRKISDKTLEGAAKKLVRWFKKNKDGIEEAEASGW